MDSAGFATPSSEYPKTQRGLVEEHQQLRQTETWPRRRWHSRQRCPLSSRAPPQSTGNHARTSAIQSEHALDHPPDLPKQRASWNSSAKRGASGVEKEEA